MTTANREGFVRVPRDILTDTRMTASRLAAWVRLASHSDNWVVKRATEAAALGVTDHTYGKILNDLVAWGYITRSKAYKNGKIAGLKISALNPNADPHSARSGQDQILLDVGAADVTDAGESNLPERGDLQDLTVDLGGLENGPNCTQTTGRFNTVIKESNTKESKTLNSSVSLISTLRTCLDKKHDLDVSQYTPTREQEHHSSASNVLDFNAHQKAGS